MSATTNSVAAAVGSARFQEIRRYQVYRLERERPRPLLRRLRRSLRARLAR